MSTPTFTQLLASRWRLGTLPLLISAAAAAESSPERPMIEIAPGGAQVGAEFGYFQCPCVRWTVQAQLAGGRIETRDFLISTDALLAYERRDDLRFQLVATELFTIGGVDAFLKGSSLGVRFDGFTWGSDLDRGSTEIFRTGLSLIVNLIQTEALRLNLRSGYEFESLQVNLSDEARRHLLAQNLEFTWQKGRWSGNVTASVGLPATELLSPEDYVLHAASQTRFRVLTLHDIELALGAGVSFTRDPFLEDWGIAPNDLSANVTMDIRWGIPGRPSLPVRRIRR